jgi:hypothetical protein
MVSSEDGPFNIFQILRFESTVMFGDNWVSRGLHCPLCISFWLGFVGAAFLPWNGVTQYFISAIALSGISTFLILIGGIPDNE